MDYLWIAIAIAAVIAGAAYVVIRRKRARGPAKKKDDGTGDIYPLW